MKSTLVLFIVLPILLIAQQPIQIKKGATPIQNEKQNVERGNTYAVVVGISDYQDPAIPDLRFADKDAEAFANYLKSESGGRLDDDHLKVLINQKATMAQFANALDWLWEVCKEGDQAIIYFSGHGDVEKKSLSQPGFLLCWDAPARVYMAGGAFALPMLQEVISTLSIQNKAKVIVITDACHSGKLAGSSVGGSQATTANLTKQFGNEIKIMSCQPNEYSIEGEQWGGGRGAFSYHLIDALYGLADANNDHWVSLQEVGRYLEDHVSSEVAPVSQVPMIIGNRNDRLSTINEKLLDDIKSGKMNQTLMLTSIESRGIEEEVLVEVDSSIRITYQLFKSALKNKIFLQPQNACADSYYEILMRESKLSKLHSTMRRNYAAALQDEAQQVINKTMKADIEILKTSSTENVNRSKLFLDELNRAAELLGENHYLYKQLKARQSFFEGYSLGTILNFNVELGQKAIYHFKKALEWQPEMPIALFGIGKLYISFLQNADSAEYYMKKAMIAAPSWILPYTELADGFSTVFYQYPKAAHYISLAEKFDSTHLAVLQAKAEYYFNQEKFQEAENIIHQIIKKTANADGTGGYYIAIGTLADICTETKRYEEAELLYKQVMAIDSLNPYWVTQLGRMLVYAGKYKEAESDFRIAGRLNDPKRPDIFYYYCMAFLYSKKDQIDEAFNAMENSMKAGFDDYDFLQQETELEILMKQKTRWHNLMKKYFPDKEKE